MGLGGKGRGSGGGAIGEIQSEGAAEAIEKKYEKEEYEYLDPN